MSRPTVLLFDIDGTLLSTDGAGRRAIDGALADVTGNANRCAFSLDGMTDPAIVRGALVSMAWPSGDVQSAIDRVLQAYVSRLAVELAKPGNYCVYPGVRDLLDAAQKTSSVLGLGTGNIRKGADLKLRHFGLDGYFSFGGFGSDHEHRPTIIRIGAERGAERLGIPREQCRVVVIGDTPRDAQAAHAIGAECVGVATGRFSTADLLGAGATHAFANLAAEDAREAVLGASDA